MSKQLYDISTAPNKDNPSGKIESGMTLKEIYSKYFQAEYSVYTIFEQSVMSRIDTKYPQRGVALLIVSHSNTFGPGYGRTNVNTGHAFITRNTGA